jgi:hypothetical protein
LKFGIQYQSAYHGVDPDVIAGYAKHAEDAGFESIYVPEHVALYPGARLGPMAIDPSLLFMDPLGCLGFIAAATKRIILGTVRGTPISSAEACDRHVGVTDSLLRTVRNKLYSVLGWRRRARSFEAGGRLR